MKKGLFGVMHYEMPKRGALSLHSSCNEGKDKKGDEKKIKIILFLNSKNIIINKIIIINILKNIKVFIIT